MTPRSKGTSMPKSTLARSAVLRPTERSTTMRPTRATAASGTRNTDMEVKSRAIFTAKAPPRSKSSVRACVRRSWPRCEPRRWIE